MVKKILLLIVWLIPILTFSQNSDTSLVKHYRLDFAIPDQPAFSIMGGTPSDILRPSNTKELSASISEFYNGGSLIIPKSFALEGAPFLIAKSNKLTLEDFDKNKILYSLRISIGTGSETIEGNTRMNLAVGARVTLFDKGDLKSDIKYRKELWELTSKELDLETLYKNEFIQSQDTPLMMIITDSTLNEKMKEYIALKKEEYEKKEKPFLKKLKETKEKYKKENWNKQKMDLAYAFMGSAPDSLLKSLKSSKHAAWMTYANPVGKWGQLLLGINYNHVMADSIDSSTNETVNFNYNVASLISRLYVGSNKFKGFVEAQYKYEGAFETNNYLVNAGSEININNGIWLILTIGITQNDFSNEVSKPSLLTGFNFRFALPEK